VDSDHLLAPGFKPNSKIPFGLSPSAEAYRIFAFSVFWLKPRARHSSPPPKEGVSKLKFFAAKLPEEHSQMRSFW
jgi:hypothetical protein